MLWFGRVEQVGHQPEGWWFDPRLQDVEVSLDKMLNPDKCVSVCEWVNVAFVV